MFFSFDHNKIEDKENEFVVEEPDPTAEDILKSLNLVRMLLHIN